VSKTHKRLQKEVFDGAFRFFLCIAAHKGLLWGETIGIDSTTIHANASMRQIVCKAAD
jgi:transposase